MKKELFRKETKDMKPYVPGLSVKEAKERYNLKTVIKLASNENPLGPSKEAVKRAKKAVENINIYPDPAVSELREKVGVKLGVKAGQIVFGNGGEHIIKIIAETFINKGDEAIMADTTFGLYASSVEFLGGKAVRVPLKNYKHDFETMLKKINTKTKLLYVCNPNNPVGNIMTNEEVDYLVKNIPADIVLILDEAYYDYAIRNDKYPDSLEILRNRENTIIIRTFSKMAGIAGLRIGYAITTTEIAKEMSKNKGTFYVNGVAQEAALGVLEDQDHIDKTVDLNYESLAIMEEYFDENNMEYVKSNANFIFVNAGIDSQIAFEELMKRGVIVRPGFLWGWDNWLRISTGTIKESKVLVETLDEVIKANIKE